MARLRRPGRLGSLLSVRYLLGVESRAVLVPAVLPMTPVEEYRRATAPWVRCSWCGTLRPPAAIDDLGSCRDTKWCCERVAALNQRVALTEAFDRGALMAWPRDYPVLTSVEGLEVVATFGPDSDPWGGP